MPLAILTVALGLSPGCPSVAPDNDSGAGTGNDSGPATGQCAPGVVNCSTDTQCDDSDPCTTDFCDAGCCDIASVDCDDDVLFCTGVESCGPDTGVCVSSGNPCRPNEICDEPSNRCRPELPEELSVSITGCPNQLNQGDSTALVAVTLNASGTVTYQWELLSGSGSLDNPTSRAPALTANDSAELAIRVTATEGATDAVARSATATCTIVVTPNSTESKRRLPACFRQSASAIISIDLNVPADVLVVGLQDNPPSGWTVSNISNDGQWDAINKAVKWFFFDDEPPGTVSYSITPSSDAEGVACFSGRVNVDGNTEKAINGHRCVGPCSGG